MKAGNLGKPQLIAGLKRDRLLVVKALFYLIITLLALAIPAYADTPHLETWTTNDGTVYQEVKVIRVEDDAVTILDKEGGALVPLVKLPPALQKRFSYDPVKAKIAADLRAKEDAENAKLLQADIDAAGKAKLAQQIADAAKLQAAQAAVANAGTKP